MAVPLVLALAQCGITTSSIEVSPPPAEARLPPEALDPLDSFVEMGSPATKSHIVSGVEHDAKTGQWRARSGAELRFLTLPLDEIRFGLNFNLPAEAVARGQAVALRVKLNGHRFMERTLTAPGPHSMDEAVPKELANWERETLVTIEVESNWRPVDGSPLQILSVGFRP